MVPMLRWLNYVLVNIAATTTTTVTKYSPSLMEYLLPAGFNTGQMPVDFGFFCLTRVTHCTR